MREDAEGKLALDAEDLGERELRNIPHPVRVFRVRAAAAVAGARAGAEAGRPELALPDRPSLVVLPFQNMGGGPGQDYFADGIPP